MGALSGSQVHLNSATRSGPIRERGIRIGRERRETKDREREITQTERARENEKACTSAHPQDLLRTSSKYWAQDLDTKAWSLISFEEARARKLSTKAATIHMLGETATLSWPEMQEGSSKSKVVTEAFPIPPRILEAGTASCMYEAFNSGHSPMSRFGFVLGSLPFCARSRLSCGFAKHILFSSAQPRHRPLGMFGGGASEAGEGRGVPPIVQAVQRATP